MTAATGLIPDTPRAPTISDTVVAQETGGGRDAMWRQPTPSSIDARTGIIPAAVAGYAPRGRPMRAPRPSVSSTETQLISHLRRHPDDEEAWHPRGGRVDRQFRGGDHRGHELCFGLFLRYATIPPDNNIAEAALRRVALGRANFLFVGNEAAGQDLAVLYTLVASCEKHGRDPIEYLTDVLIRVQSHPANRIVEILPHRWKPPGD
jgi:hypothetical protein